MKHRRVKKIRHTRTSGCRPIKVDKETHKKLKTFSRELSVLQDSNVSMGEAIRRLTKTPNCRLVLERDAIGKRRFRR